MGDGMRSEPRHLSNFGKKIPRWLLQKPILISVVSLLCVGVVLQAPQAEANQTEKLNPSLSSPASVDQSAKTIRIGGKAFTEGYILSEALALLFEQEGYKVERYPGLAGTMMAYEALSSSKIDLYPEYSGTISEVILKVKDVRTPEQFGQELSSKKLIASKPFGFNNSYAFAGPSKILQKNRFQKISDLKKWPGKIAMSHEFFYREDGWKFIKDRYQLSLKPVSMEHTFVYSAVESGEADFAVVYSTDGQLSQLDWSLLEDDLQFFPQYQPMALFKHEAPAEWVAIADLLKNTINEATIRELNSLVDEKQLSYQQAAKELLFQIGLAKHKSSILGRIESGAGRESVVRRVRWSRLFKLAGEHLVLVLGSALFAAFIAIPTGVFLLKAPRIAAFVLAGVGVLQTIPSLALLVYMIPFFGVSKTSAVVALFLYSLLPILQNTYSGLKAVDPVLLETARGLGLYPREIFWAVRWPLALPFVLAGLRVALVINVGTATIAAFIGAGGLGELIVQGLTLNDLWLMQQGAMPAALMAIFINILFQGIERRVKW